MRTLWNTSRRCLSEGSLFPPRASSTYPRPWSWHSQRGLLTLAIETSCDDTCVAILEKRKTGHARLHFNEKITSDNRAFKGIHPLTAVVSHSKTLAPLILKALRALPSPADGGEVNGDGICIPVDGLPRLRPDFVSVTRGPGMSSNLATGLNQAKGLATAWGVPLLAVNHMQAHALTPRLVNALEPREPRPIPKNKEVGAEDQRPHSPQFPFLSLLVSGGHTMLVHSRSLNDHAILANALNIAIGDMIDKCARVLIPADTLSAEGAGPMYGPMLEEFAFPGSRKSSEYDYNYEPPARRADEIRIWESGEGWHLTPPLSQAGMNEAAASKFEFAGINGQVQKLIVEYPNLGVDERRIVAQAALTLIFEHLASRLLYFLQGNSTKLPTNQSSEGPERPDGVSTVILSGGVASNKFLRHVVHSMLAARGFGHVKIVAPPVSLCTDNAAMIAWTGMEMYEDGWRSTNDVLPIPKWPLDPNAEGGGILGASGWYRAPVLE